MLQKWQMSKTYSILQVKYVFLQCSSVWYKMQTDQLRLGFDTVSFDFCFSCLCVVLFLVRTAVIAPSLLCFVDCCVVNNVLPQLHQVVHLQTQPGVCFPFCVAPTVI